MTCSRCGALAEPGICPWIVRIRCPTSGPWPRPEVGQPQRRQRQRSTKASPEETAFSEDQPPHPKTRECDVSGDAEEPAMTSSSPSSVRCRTRAGNEPTVPRSRCCLVSAEDAEPRAGGTRSALGTARPIVIEAARAPVAAPGGGPSLPTRGCAVDTGPVGPLQTLHAAETRGVGHRRGRSSSLPPESISA